jgi:hypothetical protein
MSAVSAPSEYDFLGNHVTARAALEMQIAPGDQPPLHVHRSDDEGFVLLAGEFTVFQPGREIALSPGQFVLAERGIPHTYLAGPEGARVLVISAADGFVPFSAEVAGLDGMPTPEQLTEIAARYDIEILGPPGARP